MTILHLALSSRLVRMGRGVTLRASSDPTQIGLAAGRTQGDAPTRYVEDGQTNTI